MSYAAAIDQLNALAPELYGKPGMPRRKFSLAEVRTLLDAVGDPQLGFPSVLIAGTNGKGSTAATLASVLTAGGMRCGLYTSPHLERPNERIRVGREEIADDAFARLYFRVHDMAQELVLQGGLPQLPSYFEILTALAFLYFAERKIDIAVLEVGMGGRLDATNVVTPLLSIITDISLDHMEWLGTTIPAITREKAGILRRGGTMITLPQHPEANQVLGEVAEELDVRVVSAVPFVPAPGTRGPYSIEALGATVPVESPLAGAHQQRNVALAIAAAAELVANHGFFITPAALEEGIRGTSWPGRLERLANSDVEWILDVAHNPAGAWALRAGLHGILEVRSPRVLVFSCLRDKPIAEMAQILFPLFDQVIVAPIHTARAAAVDELLAAARATGTPAIAAESVVGAVRSAQSRAASGVAVASGSVYLVGEVRTMLLAAKSESS
ncbi:Folylpolyglutamate synthase/dihydrofolate synthase [Candidatus Sulfotelmatomonas gaucii]|uniref:Dihydrofolate synthase/folylpolyglutamate synthase n=1 Tax=Candidatus Sulfuritelmatomonas gaucii TaxID=2043161 RepID=A0A2N9L370_9BACT|nr:Folylpolyglutamate synthase/dihydrofolate synthase [Candidatus Sulfotelmatomonas gaucii]